MTPALSVIIPTRDRPELLGNTLACLLAQAPPAGGWELIVVDSSRSPLRELPAPARGSARLITDAAGRPIPPKRAVARNLGARTASGSRLCFLDDDVLIAPDVLRAHADGAPDEVVLGYVFYASPETELPCPGEPFTVGPDWAPDRRDQRVQKDGAASWICVDACNFSTHRDAFRLVGGFDESFVGWGGADVELGYRLFKSGQRFRLSRQATGLEQYHPRSSELPAEAAANAQRLASLHPELADMADRFVARLNAVAQRET